MKKGHRLIIGYGSPLRGDDGLGWAVAGQLAAHIPDESVEIRVVHQLTPELVEPISEAELVIFVDASREGPVGKWSCVEVEPETGPSAPLEHQFGAGKLLGYARKVFNACPRALLVSVTGESFACCEELSETVEKVIPQVVRFICAQVAAPIPVSA